MKTDVVLAGVGGQGVLSIAAVIAEAASRAGLNVRQSEVHGMAQRGGAVLSHLRIADGVIHSDLVPTGACDLIISMEPLECLRYVGLLAKDGVAVTAAEPFENIPNYPPLADVKAALKKLPRCRLIEAASLAKEAGLARAVNMVMVGSASPFLPLDEKLLVSTIEERFAGRSPALNSAAFHAGRRAALATNVATAPNAGK